MPRTPTPKTIDNYSPELALYRGLTPFRNLNNFDGNLWRTVARSQPIVMDCITTITMHIQALPYSIRVRDSQKSDELKDTVEYYLDVFKSCQNGDGILPFIDSLLQDLYMTPFGGAVEAVRYKDGRLYTFKTVDAATMFLSDNDMLPYFQYVPESGKTVPVYFSTDELIRLYQTPRNEVLRRKWQMSPVEKAYLAIEMLNRGDRYYANLLLDTPEAGLLDLGDMSKESAEQWLKSFRDMFTGVDAFKIPVIFEHTTPAKYIPFGRPPTDLMFNEISGKYAQILTAAFGLTLGDIGFKTSNGSLSSDIRDERHSKSTGFASAKALVTAGMNKLLPSELEFWFIDVDDELLVSKGRARSANAVAMRNLIESGLLAPEEGRAQLKADGLLTIPLSEEVDEQSFDIIKEINGTADQFRLQEQQLELQKQAQAQNLKEGKEVHVKGGQAGFNLDKRRNVRGGKMEAIQGKEPVTASSGGQGEIKSEYNIESILLSLFSEVNPSDVQIKRLLRAGYRAMQKSEPGEIWKLPFREYVEKMGLVLSDYNKDDIWWTVTLTSDIFDEMVDDYKQGLYSAAEEIQNELYETGQISKLEDLDINVTNAVILEKLRKQFTDMQDKVNSGTEYFLTLIIYMLLDEYFTEYGEGEAIELALQDFKDMTQEMFDERAKTIAEHESLIMQNWGRLEQYEKIGVKAKKIIHIGNDTPCEGCIDNIDIGIVPLEYLYDDKMGGKTKVAPFHPHCHCKTVYADLPENVVFYDGS